MYESVIYLIIRKEPMFKFIKYHMVFDLVLLFVFYIIFLILFVTIQKLFFISLVCVDK